MRTGIVNLPLHYGRAPAWLFSRMAKLSSQITLAIIKEYGPDEFLRKISDPLWFQAFGCVLGFDWHSSGLTTTVCGALKQGLKDISREIGVFVCGGKGAASRKTPREIEAIGQKRLFKINPDELIYASKMAAKVDNTALQDGYQLYQHSFFFTASGKWTIVQQGMNVNKRWARRYHWLGEEVANFVCEPHKAICCDYKGRVLNMVATESEGARRLTTQLARESSFKVVNEFKKIKQFDLGSHHAISLDYIRPENLSKILIRTYERKPENFEQFLGIEGVGPKTVRALALISELIYGKSPSFRDPVKFSFAHGGKDGHPYPVNKAEYDLSIQILQDAINKAKISHTEKLSAIRRLATSI